MAGDITLRYILTEADYARAVRFNLLTFKFLWVLYGAFAVILILLVLMLIGTVYLGRATWPAILPYVALYGVLGFALWTVYWFLPRWMMRKFPAAGIEEQAAFSDEAVSIQNALTHNDLAWDYFTRAVESKEFFLLYSGRNLFYPIPKRSLADPQALERLRDLIRAHVPDFRGGKPGS